MSIPTPILLINNLNTARNHFFELKNLKNEIGKNSRIFRRDQRRFDWMESRNQQLLAIWRSANVAI